MKISEDDSEDRTFRISRLLDAPVARVWAAWTQPEALAQWWGPAGFSSTIHEMDVRANGEWRLTLHGPDGKKYPNRSIFLEIVPEEKIVFGHFNPDYTGTILFEVQGSKTRMTWSNTFKTRELFDTVVKIFKADEGLEQSADKLEQYLADETA
ncbi:MAG: SRPBCC domain-containing protein [Mucilaginibacter polytrichastri]|nr:SRPBCC domain-containing protein [Mucilaginibacter polytrichastri]